MYALKVPSCSLVRYVILAIYVAKIDFIVFMASLEVKYAKNIVVQFFPPLNLVLWHIQNGRHRNHIFGHNLASSKASHDFDVYTHVFGYEESNSAHTKCVSLVDI